MEPPAGVPRWNGIDDPHEATIEDARGLEPEFTLDRNGFALVKAPTAVVYYPEIERLLCEKLATDCKRLESRDRQPTRRWIMSGDSRARLFR